MTEYACDILVVGSGAGGLATAVAAAHHHQNVLVVEKEPVFGGTSARSGGWLWIPASPPARRAGVDDSAEKARIYLQHETGPHFNAARVDAYLEHAPKAVDFFEQNTAVKFDLGPFVSDYHPTSPGGMPGGRSIVARPYDGRDLGFEIKRLRPPLREITLFGMMLGIGKDLWHFFNVTRSPISALFVGRMLLKFVRDVALYGRSMN
jgi:succinate dehydrogenase/fumarate reductase flavoprotein subunit